MLEVPTFSKEIPSPEELEKIAADFPWFVSRMMTDNWSFGLLVSDKLVIVVETINRIREHGGIVWLDVEMVSGNDRFDAPTGLTLMFSPTERTTASVRADAVIAAFELADT